MPLEVTELNKSVEPLYYLLGHESNVCALDSKFGIVVSGSWDKTARIWEDGKIKHVLKGHNQAVWAVSVLTKSLVLTGSADKTIRLWKDGTCKRVFKGHTDAIRGIDILSDSTFVSCSNDASVRMWSIDSEESVLELYGHTSFIYSVKALSNGDVITSGEDRSCRVWRAGECIQVITLPCVSLWSIAVNKETGDFAVGGSDYTIRVYTRDPKRCAPDAERKALEEAVANSGIGKDQMEAVNKESLSGLEGLQVNGQKEGEIKMIRAETNTVDAYQWSGGVWIKIGEVVGQGSSSNSKKAYNGQEYDYVFDVDIQDGVPALKLPYNLSENPYDSARKFLELNELPSSYLDQVAQFIITNSEGVNLSAKAPAADIYGTRYLPGGSSTQPTSSAVTNRKVNTAVVPIKNYVQLVTYQPAPIAKAIRTFNSKQDVSAQLSESELSQVEVSLSSINSQSAQFLYSVISRILTTWDIPSMLPALDLLRIIIPNLETFSPAALIKQLLSCMDVDVPKHCLLAIRGLVNLFNCPNSQAIQLVDNASARETVFNTIKDILTKSTGSVPSNIAISSLCLNYAVLTFKKSSSTNCAISADLFLHQFIQFYPYLDDSESRYRLFLAIGTLLSTAGPQGKKAVSKLISSYKNLNAAEDRLKNVVADIQALLS